MGRKMLISLLLAALLILAGGLPGHTVVVTFDDLTSREQVPATYAGLNWSNFSVFDQPTYIEEGGWYNNYNPPLFFPSPLNCVFNSYAAHQSVASNGPINVVGAYFSTCAKDNTWIGASSHGINVSGYLGATLRGTVSVPLTLDFIYVPLNFKNIDKLVIKTWEQDPQDMTYWLMDNLEYTAATPVPAVPLPGILYLLLGSD
jgi:hypothetical protein